MSAAEAATIALTTAAAPASRVPTAAAAGLSDDAERRVREAEAAAAAAVAACRTVEETSALQNVRIETLEAELHEERTASAAASSSLASAHAAELDAASTSARQQLSRTARLTQSQCRELHQTRAGWATCTLYAYLAGRSRLSEASALRRWQRACLVGGDGGGDARGQPPPPPPPTPPRSNSAAPAEGSAISEWQISEWQILLLAQRQEARALCRGWATSKLSSALQPIHAWPLADAPALMLAWRLWLVACSTASPEGTAPQPAVARAPPASVRHMTTSQLRADLRGRGVPIPEGAGRDALEVLLQASTEAAPLALADGSVGDPAALRELRDEARCQLLEAQREIDMLTKCLEHAWKQAP
jgi:hypothetical protein